MEHKSNQQKLKLLILCAGLLGAALRHVLYATGMDAKGLLTAGHWAGLAILALTFLVAAALVFLCRGIQGPQSARDSFPPSAVTALGSFVGAVGFCLAGLSDLKQAAFPLDRVTAWLCLGSAAALVYAGVCRFLGRLPFFGAHALVSVSLALRMVCQYRHWSADPQLQDYIFYMLAHVALMLTAYHLAAFDGQIGRHRPLWFLGLCGAYFSLLCLPYADNSLFMLCCALWALLSLSELSPRPRRVRPSMGLSGEAADENS